MPADAWGAMLKDEHKVILVSIIFSLSIWVLDAVIDTVIFSEGPFLNELLFDVRKVCFRTVSAISFILFGAGMARILKRRKHVDEALQESEGKYRSLVESTEDSIYLVDRNYRYLFVNKKHLSRLGLPEDRLLGHTYSEYHSTEEASEFAEHVDSVFATGESLQHEHKSQRDNRYFLRTMSPVKDQDGKITAITVVSKQITERKRMEEELRALSLTDALTGLYNRRGFLALADQQLKIAGRLKRGISLLSADMDNLKVVNDTLGHKGGDAALIEVAGILKESFRESDIIARIGGDEFVVLLIENTSGDSEMLTARLLKNLEARNAASRSFRLSISFGLASSAPESLCSVDELLAKADKLMYEQKRLNQKHGADAPADNLT